MTSMQEMFWDTYERYYHSTGMPPLAMVASPAFREELKKEFISCCELEPSFFDPPKGSIPTNRMYYGGVAIDCVLNSDLPTLLCVAP